MRPAFAPALAFALALLVAASNLAAAQRSLAIPPDAAGEQDSAGTALVDAFAKFCLDRFPAPARMEAAAPGQVTALPPATVRQYLHEDPGHAWRYVANGATYIVTVEDPPYQIWVPEVRSPAFRSEAHCQSAAVAASVHAPDDQAFTDAVMDWAPEQRQPVAGRAGRRWAIRFRRSSLIELANLSRGTPVYARASQSGRTPVARYGSPPEYQ